MSRVAIRGIVVTVCLAGFLAASPGAFAQGACCLSDNECLEVGSQVECNQAGGVLLEGESCAGGQCEPAACCHGVNCFIAGAFECITNGRDYAGAGTTCLDDPCESGVGVCCMDGECAEISPEDCDSAGGIWLGAGTFCNQGYCDLGACCSPGACDEGALYECNAAQGTFLLGGTCEGGAACEIPGDCSLDSLASQSPDGPDAFTAYVSEQSAGLHRWETFSNVIGAVDTVRWWGFDMQFDGDFTECVESNNVFQITFHEDLAGLPGPTVCSYTLPVHAVQTGIAYETADLVEYDVILPTPCAMVEGWISIVGAGDPECWFLWLSSADGDHSSYCDNCSISWEADDLSFCLGGTAGGVFGACCDQSTGDCTDGVAMADCVGAGIKFTADSLCSELDPPCAATEGGCCFEDGECFPDLPNECESAGGNWLGAGASCDLCPAVGACCFDELNCSYETETDCDLLGRTWLGEGSSCDECPATPECSLDSLYSQSPEGPSEFLAATSEESADLRRWDDFTAVAGAIERVDWWGVDLDRVGNNWIECVESDPNFRVGFHEDAGGAPGAQVCSYTLTSSYTPTGIMYLGTELNAYGVTLPEPCVLVNGWVSIVGLGDPECWFLWMSAGIGDSWCDNCIPSEQDIDLSFCLGGTPGGEFGACCDDQSAICTDDVEITDCLGEGQRFAPGQTCESLDPPCGVILGACCMGDGTCSQELAFDCLAAGGDWLGANTLCDQCPCVVPCPPESIQEGEPVCGDGYIDTYNAGCSAEPPVFSPIEFGDTVCGESGAFQDGVEINGDFDWYELHVQTPSQITWSVEAEFRPRLWIYDGNDGCPGEPLSSNAVFECEDLSISAFVAPGVYWLVVHPNGATDSAECPSPYTATVTQNPVGLLLLVDRDGLSWTDMGGATRYDLVRGDLGILLGTGGDFANATDACLANDQGVPFLDYAVDPEPGEGHWFVVRTVIAAGNGTYDSGASSQAGSRDEEINLSISACP